LSAALSIVAPITLVAGVVVAVRMRERLATVSAAGLRTQSVEAMR
jgi:hypothetical protein